jgi:Transposase C of IS166 homeodomain
VTDHVLHLGDHFIRFQRLPEEAAVGRNVDVRQLSAPETTMILIGGQRSWTAWATVASFTRQRPSRKPLPDHLPRERMIVYTTTPTVTFIERNQNEIDKIEDVLAA